MYVVALVVDVGHRLPRRVGSAKPFTMLSSFGTDHIYITSRCRIACTPAVLMAFFASAPSAVGLSHRGANPSLGWASVRRRNFRAWQLLC